MVTGAGRLEGRDPVDRLLENARQGGAGERPDQNDEARGHERDEHPAGHIPSIVVEVAGESGAETGHDDSFRGRDEREQ